MKQHLKRLLGRYYTPRLRHLKRQMEVRFLGKGESELMLLPRLLDRSQVAIDIGVNIGDYFNVLARHSRRTIGFEPHPGCYAYLKAAGLRNGNVLNLALSDHAGTAVLKVPVQEDEVTGLATIEATNASILEGANRMQTYEVEVARLDDVVKGELRAGERIGFIKIDVEGHEFAVLKGAKATIGAHRPIVMLETEYRHGAPVPAIFAFFTDQEYVAKALLKGRMEDVDPKRLEELQKGIGIADIVKDARDSIYVNNVLFIPRERLGVVRGLSATG